MKDKKTRGSLVDQCVLKMWRGILQYSIKNIYSTGGWGPEKGVEIKELVKQRGLSFQESEGPAWKR